MIRKGQIDDYDNRIFFLKLQNARSNVRIEHMLIISLCNYVDHIVSSTRMDFL
jgi:hypothetical protein